MHLVIALLGVLALFLYLTLDAVKKPEKKYFFYLYVIIDLWLGSVFAYLIITAFMH